MTTAKRPQDDFHHGLLFVWFEANAPAGAEEDTF